jgi:RNA-binding protein
MFASVFLFVYLVYFVVAAFAFLPVFRPGLPHSVNMLPLNNAQIRELKARAQLLKPALKVGKEGLTPQFFAELDVMLRHQELLKVKFEGHKEEKKELAPQLAEKTGSHLITRLGNVVVLYRPKPVVAEPAEPSVQRNRLEKP